MDKPRHSMTTRSKSKRDREPMKTNDAPQVVDDENVVNSTLLPTPSPENPAVSSDVGTTAIIPSNQDQDQPEVENAPSPAVNTLPVEKPTETNVTSEHEKEKTNGLPLLPTSILSLLFSFSAFFYFGGPKEEILFAQLLEETSLNSLEVGSEEP